MLPAAAHHCQADVGVVQLGKQLQRKVRRAQPGVQRAAEHAADGPAAPAGVHHLGGGRHQRGESQLKHLVPAGGQRAGLVVGQRLAGDKGGVHRAHQLQFPRPAARRLVAAVGRVGVQQPQHLFAGDGCLLQRKGGAVGRGHRRDKIKVIDGVQPLDLQAGVLLAAGLVQNQLAESRPHRGGVRRQPGQPQRQRAALLCAVFQRLVHQAFVGKGQVMQHHAVGGAGAGRRGGRGLAVPQFQQMDLVALLRQAGRQPPPQLRVDGLGRFDAVNNKQKAHTAAPNSMSSTAAGGRVRKRIGEMVFRPGRICPSGCFRQAKNAGILFGPYPSI